MAHSELFNCPAPLPLDSAHRSILKLGRHTTRSASRQAPLVELVRPLAGLQLRFTDDSQTRVEIVTYTSTRCFKSTLSNVRYTMRCNQLAFAQEDLIYDIPCFS